MRKQGEKTGDLIDKKPPKLNKGTRKKTDHLLLLCKVKNLRNLDQKMGRKTEC